jgi:hypothetical protein
VGTAVHSRPAVAAVAKIIIINSLFG